MGSPYQKLKSNHFRLLEKVTGAHDRDLRFRFRHAAPGQTPIYTAVSYTWGGDVESEVIYVDNQPIRVRPNIWACLLFLRRSWRFIWADAICINQKNTAEKNEQVRMMEHIYTGADVVSTWLGNVPLPSWLHYEGPIVDVEVDDFDWEDWMKDIASRPYWSRSWVIQEFLLAQEVHIYCSNARVDGNYFRKLLERAAEMNHLGVKIADLVNKPDVMRQWPALPLVVGRHIDRYPDLRQPLYDLLAGHPYAQSTDPRDKVFALLGLLPRDDLVLLERSFPDYSMSAEQVNVITLAHLKFFAGDRPAAPIFRALRIDKGGEIRRLMWIVERFAYIGAEDPVAQVESIATDWPSNVEDDIGSPTAQQTYDNVFTHSATLNNVLHRLGGTPMETATAIMDILHSAYPQLIPIRAALVPEAATVPATAASWTASVT